MAAGPALGESHGPIGGLVKVRPDVMSGLSFLRIWSHRGHCGQSGPCFLDCAAFKSAWEKHVGKGDRRTRRGKIYAGTFGKSRPKDPKRAKATGSKPVTTTARPAAKKAPAKKAKA
jgi:30S ribosomal protein S31